MANEIAKDTDVVFEMQISIESIRVHESVAARFASDSFFSGDCLRSGEPVFEGIELGAVEKELIAGRVHKKIMDVLASSVGDQLVSSVESGCAGGY